MGKSCGKYGCISTGLLRTLTHIRNRACGQQRRRSLFFFSVRALGWPWVFVGGALTFYVDKPPSPEKSPHLKNIILGGTS